MNTPDVPPPVDPAAIKGNPERGEVQPVHLDTVAQVDAQVVEESGEALVKVCPKCSVQSSSGGSFCPNCGAAYVSTRRAIRFSKKVVLIGIGVLVIAAAGTGVTLSIQHTNQVKAEQEAAAAAAEVTKTRESEAAKAAASAASAAAAKQAAESLKRTQRKAIVKALEDSVLKDAQERVTTGVLTGPITLASCTPLGGGSTDDLTAITGTFQCIAVNKTNADGSSSGYRFSATANWNDASYTWHLGS